MWLYHGSPYGLMPHASWGAQADQAYAKFGVSVAGAGDVNGDGFDDVVIGAPFYDYRAIDEGRAWVYLGSASGLGPASWTYYGGQPDAHFGERVAGVGDVNGDGYDEVLVASPAYESGQIWEGRVWLYHGTPGGPTSYPVWKADGDGIWARFGQAISGAGDVDGDGFDDVLVGSPYFVYTPSGYQGRVKLYLGSPWGLSWAAAWEGQSSGVGDYYGWSVSTAGDVDADGFSDVIIGVLRYENGEAYEGGAWLYLGG